MAFFISIENLYLIENQNKKISGMKFVDSELVITCDELDLYVPDQMTVCVIAPSILPVQFDGNFEAAIVISVIGWFGKPILTFDFGVLQPFDSTVVPWPAE